LLLLFIAFVVLVMAVGPGLYDSKRRYAALGHSISAQSRYVEARSADNKRGIEEAEREIKQAEQERQDAKRLDRRDLLVFELFMLGILGLSVYAFVRAGRAEGLGSDRTPSDPIA
jgi:hypothetical protein